MVLSSGEAGRTVVFHMPAATSSSSHLQTARGSRKLGHSMSGDMEVKLSPRELQCLSLLANGFSNDGIAKEVGIRPPTVAMHLANARAKLKAVTREHAVALAVSKGLIKL